MNGPSLLRKVRSGRQIRPMLTFLKTATYFTHTVHALQIKIFSILLLPSYDECGNIHISNTEEYHFNRAYTKWGIFHSVGH